MLKLTLSSATVFLLIINCNYAVHAQTSQTVVSRDIFNGQRAMEDLVKQVEFGPRLPDSPGIASTRKLIEDTLTQNGFSIERQSFTAKSPILGYDVNGINLYGIYPKGSTVKYVVSAHYDTRPYADQETDPSLQREPVPGANDGASGVAALLELARAIPKTKPSHGVALVFFDVEDHGMPSNEDGFCLGSKHFARNLPESLKNFQCGINLDMIAEANLHLPIEGWSQSKAPKQTYGLWQLGNRMAPETWKMEKGPSVYDDHMPFLAIGKPYIDVIDIRYPEWHTTRDTPEKCSAQSLDNVGDIILEFIQH